MVEVISSNCIVLGLPKRGVSVMSGAPLSPSIGLDLMDVSEAVGRLKARWKLKSPPMSYGLSEMADDVVLIGSGDWCRDLRF